MSRFDTHQSNATVPGGYKVKSQTLDPNDVISARVACLRAEVQHNTYHRSTEQIVDGMHRHVQSRRLPIKQLTPEQRADLAYSYEHANHIAVLRTQVQSENDFPPRGIQNAPQPHSCSAVRRHPLLWWRLVFSAPPVSPPRAATPGDLTIGGSLIDEPEPVHSDCMTAFVGVCSALSVGTIAAWFWLSYWR